ncbi:MAG: redoxin domain-containing protein [Gemmataceae bacterium]|nr:redoxin domain-containing protein [Gemmataceae bacterium]
MHSRNAILALVIVLASATVASSQDGPKIGDSIGKLKFTDIRSLPRTLDDFDKKQAYVLVFTNTSCPLVKRYLPSLQAMEKEFRGKGVQFVAVNSAEEDSIVTMATQAVQHEMEFPFVKDFGGSCARALGVRRTPEVVVLDAERRLRYRGRIDDQYRLGGVRKEVTSHDLLNALEAVLAGRKVEKSETEVDGCPITLVKERKPREFTFAEHVAPILQKHCWECHQSGGSAPFALTSYKQASARAESLAEVVREQRMPPWFASHEFGPFVNRRGLSDEERTTVIDWVRSGAAQGDAKKTPATPKAPESKWLIGAPDLVLHSDEIKLPAKGDIPYQYAILPHVFIEDTWIQGAQIMPDQPGLLHHGNMGYANLAEGFNESNFITGQVPGGEPMSLDVGVAYRIPKGSVLALQLHFVATGKPEKCKVSVGLRYPREVVQNRLHNMQLTDRKFAIPPGAPAHKVAASRALDRDVLGVGLFSHMHLRGKDMTFTAHLPNGKADTLLIIPNYNFSWQLPYRWEPGKMRLPKGTRLECVAHFDNSAFNPYNPNPLATVRNGPQTHHEMMFGFFFYTNAVEQLGINVDVKTGAERKNRKNGSSFSARTTPRGRKTNTLNMITRDVTQAPTD